MTTLRTGNHFDGQNNDAAGLLILANHCSVDPTSAAIEIDNIEAGSECTVVEQGVAGFPTGTVVTHDPAGVDTTPFFVDANETVDVTVTNDFTGVQVGAENVTPEPAISPAESPVAVTPQFTG